ncbi:hypothetical protein GALMADRAFT_233958 [Galerina marginata CBS 339.88]|uniref:Copper-fist domain-containing protein n=1 Tax=Galerina marginata (strain CBS 339.88) TaxID=685588 RepID=A0A067TYY6_GALM3|nr:hypothetical protein GALMADRAFT_233958 [Galerina marginata CBS 339.88]
MVFVNSQKFACESCIKGHRSSSCHHTDRPLFEIKKKGRPVSQCTKCRELRQSKKYHSKCTCNPQSEGTSPAVQPLASSSGSKTKRFIPIVPALPNGLRDMLSASQSSTLPPDSRQRVDSLLNPCECSSLWKCNCRAFKDATLFVSDQTTGSADALSTLALAAAMQCCSPLPSDSTPSFDISRTGKQTNHLRLRPMTPDYSSNKRPKHHARHSPTPGPDLAPIIHSLSSSSQSSAMPEFPSMPSMSEITSLAGSGCTCGVQCSCPGCVEHRGQMHANGDHKDCAEGCGTCVDPTIEHRDLPNLPGSSIQTPSGSSFLDRFFARAAALPPPPGSKSFTFGLVNLPKLECCGGQCNCPAGHCTCRASCGGCCTDAHKRQRYINTSDRQSAERIFEPQATEDVPLKQPLGTCCEGTT